MAVSKINADLAHVDVSIKDYTIASTGYLTIVIPIPIGYIPYSWIWFGNAWDDKIIIELGRRTGDAVINIVGPANRTLGDYTIRVFYRKFYDA